MEKKYTPGPWCVDPGFLGDIQKDGEEIGTTWNALLVGTEITVSGTCNIGPEQQKANALLMAAAPELLEALEEMVSVFNGIDPNPDAAIDALNDARAAIAKALGTFDPLDQPDAE